MAEGKDRSSSSYLLIPIVLRFLEICFCIASFVIMTFMKMDYKGFNSTCYLFAMAITGLCLSVIAAAVTFLGRKPGMAVNAIRIQLYISFMMLLLLFGAAATASSFRVNACFNGLGLLNLFGDDCTLLAWSVAMGYLASFTYIGSFWHFFFLLANDH
ncbi:hypothetical protein CLOM_g4133 [Closterium sp. NIES-68]|nr:hypothetical protein CLOM_g4133 [Closterium sp. NIES-68]GJP62909.1 hypothetical protein CLOP_g19975 [Closterium sp. NIES-67]GJP83635.1 hypothetical protein CLOP_g13762 [Closterium sp. NIES-67]